MMIHLFEKRPNTGAGESRVKSGRGRSKNQSPSNKKPRSPCNTKGNQQRTKEGEKDPQNGSVANILREQSHKSIASNGKPQGGSSKPSPAGAKQKQKIVLWQNKKIISLILKVNKLPKTKEVLKAIFRIHLKMKLNLRLEYWQA
jgi:hypothetical protein